MCINKSYLKKSILDTQNQIDLVKKEYAKLNLPQYIIDLEVSSLTIKLEELKNNLKKLNASNNKESMIITFHPPGLKSGEIPVRTLSPILGDLQYLTDSIANAQHNNSNSNSGPIPNDILERNSLIIREVKAGSFKVTLDFPDLPDDQLTFEDDNSRMEDASLLDKMLLLINSSDNDETLLQTISDLGDRVLSKYISFIRSLKESNTPIELDFKNSHNESKQVKLDIPKIETIFNKLNEKLEVIENNIDVVGILTGANVRTNKFEMYTDTQGKISGNLSKNYNYKLELGKKYSANIIETKTTNLATNKSKTSMILNNLTEIN